MVPQQYQSSVRLSSETMTMQLVMSIIEFSGKNNPIMLIRKCQNEQSSLFFRRQREGLQFYYNSYSTHEEGLIKNQFSGRFGAEEFPDQIRKARYHRHLGLMLQALELSSAQLHSAVCPFDNLHFTQIISFNLILISAWKSDNNKNWLINQ